MKATRLSLKSPTIPAIKKPIAERAVAVAVASGEVETGNGKPKPNTSYSSDTRPEPAEEEPELPSTPSRSNSYERERYSRSPRRDNLEPEKISVEMTPLEQDIYALMGISPLVRVEREVKNPKAVVVNVKDPDEGNETAAEPAKREEIVAQPATPSPVTTTAVLSQAKADTEAQETEDESRPTIRRRRRRSSALES
jgi:ribonuclease E